MVKLSYVMRTRNVVDYLILNHVLKRYELPLAGFADGVDLTFFRSKLKWVSSLWHEMFLPYPTQIYRRRTARNNARQQETRFDLHAYSCLVHERERIHSFHWFDNESKLRPIFLS